MVNILESGYMNLSRRLQTTDPYHLDRISCKFSNPVNSDADHIKIFKLQARKKVIILFLNSSCKHVCMILILVNQRQYASSYSIFSYLRRMAFIVLHLGNEFGQFINRHMTHDHYFVPRGGLRVNIRDQSKLFSSLR